MIGAFTVISVVSEESSDEDISTLANLHQRSPLMATVLTLSIISLSRRAAAGGFHG